MINAIGGVDIYNERGINDPSTGIQMGVGPVHLNGALAILYVRSREGRAAATTSERLASRPFSWPSRRRWPVRQSCRISPT